MKLVTAAEMRQLDEKAIKELGIPSVVLMENAGRATYEILRREFPDVDGPVVVVAGRGNNGGDGFVVARYLAMDGFFTVVLLLAEKAQLTGDARVNLEIAERLGIIIQEVTSPESLREHGVAVEEAALVVDAILGTGLNSEVRGLYREAIEMINAGPAPVLAVDIPSGLAADSGEVLGTAVMASVTATYGWPKLGQILGPGRELVGRLWQVDISIPPEFAEEVTVELAEAEELVWMLPPRPLGSHKGTYGHLVVAAGSTGKTGAAALAALGGLRVGTGLVTAAIPASLNPILEVKLTEPMTLPLAEVAGGGALGEGALGQLEEFLADKAALALGPGLGTHPETQELVRQLVRRVAKPMVIDADGLNALAGHLDCLTGAPGPRMVTPHPGEMARLLGVTVREIQSDRLGQAQALARRSGATVVLKGAQTVIADPEGLVTINSTGNPALASGGTGDVLTGMIGGFLAQRMEPGDAARLGVFLHGLAADRWLERRGEMGLMAGELVAELPKVIKAFSLGKIPAREEGICYRLVIS